VKPPDVLLLDVCMPDRDGLKVLEDILLIRP
jgi:CheY-like chemotaxis protein